MSAQPISFVIGRRRGHTSTSLATVIFPTRHWTRPQAIAWLKRHKFKAAPVETLRGSIRATQHPSSAFTAGSLRTIHTSGHPQPLKNPKGVKRIAAELLPSGPVTIRRIVYFYPDKSPFLGDEVLTGKPKIAPIGSHARVIHGVHFGGDDYKLFATARLGGDWYAWLTPGDFEEGDAFVAGMRRSRKHKPKARANPTLTAGPRKLVVPEREYRQAITLYRKFREADPQRIAVHKLVMPRMLMQIGRVPWLYYFTTHKGGKPILYKHKFAPHAQPTLAASHDGRALFLIGGQYDFTGDGIIDRK